MHPPKLPAARQTLTPPHHTTVLLLITLALLSHSVGVRGADPEAEATSSSVEPAEKGNGVCSKADATRRFPSDLVCNNGTKHACICRWADHRLRDDYADCLELVADTSLQVVGMVVMNLNLSGVLWTGEPYASFFKRKIANLISRSCEQNANQCPGTALSVDQEQVVILRVECRPDNRTAIQFAVVQATNIHALKQSNTMDPGFVARVLSEQLQKLQRLLGMAKISQLKSTAITLDGPGGRRAAKKQSNTILIIIVSCVGAFLMTTYVIAIYKVCKDYHEKKHARKERQESPTPPKSTSPMRATAPANYGATSSTSSNHNIAAAVNQEQNDVTPVIFETTKSKPVPRLAKQASGHSQQHSNTSSRASSNASSTARGHAKNKAEPTTTAVVDYNHQQWPASSPEEDDERQPLPPSSIEYTTSPPKFATIRTRASPPSSNTAAAVTTDHFDRFEESNNGGLTKSLSDRSISKLLLLTNGPPPPPHATTVSSQMSSDSAVGRSATIHDFPDDDAAAATPGRRHRQHDEDSSSPSSDEDDEVSPPLPGKETPSAKTVKAVPGRTPPAEKKAPPLTSKTQPPATPPPPLAAQGGFEDTFLDSIGSYKALEPSVTTLNDPWTAAWGSADQQQPNNVSNAWSSPPQTTTKTGQQPPPTAVKPKRPQQANGGIHTLGGQNDEEADDGFVVVQTTDSGKSVQKKVKNWPADSNSRKKKKRQQRKQRRKNEHSASSSHSSSSSSDTSSSSEGDVSQESGSDAENLLATGEYLQLAESVQSLDTAAAAHQQPASPHSQLHLAQKEQLLRQQQQRRTEDDEAWENGASLC